MDFYRLDQVPDTPGDVTYRYRLLPTLVITLLMGIGG
jgi:hypothetical protein